MFWGLWNFLRFFGCLSARDKCYDKLKSQDKTLGGRISKKGTRPIPKAFLDRFLEQHARLDPNGTPVKKAVIDYYTKALTKGDYDFEPSEEISKYIEIFEEQLEAVKDKNLDSSETPQVISHDEQWRVVRTLGSGSYGEVYLLEWYPYGTMAPISFALKECCNDPFWGNYCAEGELTRRLNATGCPNVVKIYDWIESKDPDDDGEQVRLFINHYFRMLYDYYEHGDLNRLMKYYDKNSFIIPESFVWHTIHQIATALLYCAKGQPAKRKSPGWEEIVHLDVKPTNILIGPDASFGEVYPKLLLTDFGLAHTIPNEEVRAYKKAFPRGTPDFVAPETEDSRNRHGIGIASDIYSLGRALDQILDKKENLIYTKQELEVVWRQPDIDRYLPYSSLLKQTKAECTRDSPAERPTIFQLWELSRKQATLWADIVRENRIKAFEQGKVYYYGMVLFDEAKQQRARDIRELKAEFEKETQWKFKNRDRVQEIKEEVIRVQAGLLPLRKI